MTHTDASHRFTPWLLAMLAVMLLCPDSHAGFKNLEEGLPVRVNDAYPIPYLGREIQLLFRYEEIVGDPYRMDLVPVLEFGFPINTQWEISVPLIFGKTDKTGSADIRVGVLYNLNMERVFFPAISFKAAIDAPTGKDSRGVDPRFALILTKTLATGLLSRVHFNGVYQLNTDPRDTERRHLYDFVVGYSQRITPNAIVILDFFHKREFEEDIEVNFFEAGTRVALNHLTVVSVGAGFGIGDESPRFRATIALQRSLSGRYIFF